MGKIPVYSGPPRVAQVALCLVSTMKINALLTWRHSAQGPEAGQPAEPGPVEICELCSVKLSALHRHLAEVGKRNMVCVCDPCALRFENVLSGRFKLVPRDVCPLLNFQMTEAEWENLALPVNPVFIFHCSVTGRPTAVHPSPAGAVESLPPLTAWRRLAVKNPELNAFQPDVEALLINRTGKTSDYFRAPLDLCYELTGLIRKNSSSPAGGEKFWVEIETFFARLRAQTSRFTPHLSPDDIYA